MSTRPLLLLVALLVLGVAPTSAHAEFGFVPGSFTAQTVDAAGDPELRAGAHPDRLQLNLAFNLAGTAPDGNVKDLRIELPRGFVGDPGATVLCPREQVAIASPIGCPPESQIGVISLAGFSFPIYNSEPAPGQLADFAFRAFLVSLHLTARMSADGQTFVIELSNAVQDAGLSSMNVELWGTPADHQTGAPIPRRALLTAPTRCDGPPALTVRARSWQEQDVWRTATTEMTPLTGCESLSFEPRLDVELDSAVADTPTGAELNLVLPQNDDPDGQAGDRIADVDVELPEGMTLSPSAANGLSACPDEAVGLGEAGPASCPPSATVGAVTLSTPLLPNPLVGRIYMGRQLPGTDYRLFVVASAPGIDVKLPLTLHADPETGRLSTRMSGLPPVPFDRLTLRFAGGSRAALVTPLLCGAAVATATFTPHGGGPSVTSADAAAIVAHPSGRPCPDALPFAPGFVAGAARARAGAASPFVATVRRRDGEQPLSRFRMKLPPGVSARLGSARRCPGTAVATAGCPPGARVGSVAAEAGSGSTPFPLRGDVFLTGPYRGAPFGLALVFRGVAGPFDLGTIVVRAALRLDPRTAQVTVDSDALPRVVRGIPLRIQTIAIDVDRPGFMTNPTSCAPTEVAAVVESTGGAVARPASRFAVGGCRSLRFRPAVSLALTDRSELHQGGHPGVRLRMRTTARGSNVRAMSVELPKLLGATAIGPKAVCSLEQVNDGRCPADARIGGASGRTPLLSTPLKGAIYMVQPPGKGLPDVWAVMRGMGVSVKLRMTTVLVDGQVRGKLADLPDIPLSSFTMAFASGKHGMFSATRDPCADGRARRMRAKARLTGHSGAKRRLTALVRVAPGC